MRSADGEENLTPFRSLEDLLSAIKPILWSGARSPDPVWLYHPTSRFGLVGQRRSLAEAIWRWRMLLIVTA